MPDAYATPGPGDPSILTGIQSAVAQAVSATSTNGTAQAPTNGSWTTPQWYIDPVNGIDTNNGTSPSTALKTWAGLTKIWGTISPTLQQNTNIQFLSSHVDGSDPVIFRPVVMNGAQVTIQGGAALVYSFRLASVTAKNRTIGANSPLIVNNASFDATYVNLIARRSTDGSRAWVYAASGNNLTMTQPLLPQAPGFTTLSAQEVDNWAAGNAVTFSKPYDINIADIEPTVVGFNSTSGNYVCIYNCNIFNPSGNNEQCYLGENVELLECSSDRILVYGPSAKTYIVNVLAKFGQIGNSACVLIFAGAINKVPAGTGTSSNTFSGPLIIGGDYIVGKTLYLQGAAGGIVSSSRFGSIYLDASVYLETGVLQTQPIYGDGGITYGSAGPGGGGGNSYRLQGTSKLVNQTGNSFVSTYTAPFIVATGFICNSASVGTALGTDGVLHQNRALTPTNLDAAIGVGGFAGGYGDLAYVWGGASIGVLA